MSKNRGITLIALVITIIILLILAGITIGSITGEKNVIKEARTAKELAELAALEEQVELAIVKAEQKHRNPNLEDVIEEIKNNKVISNADQVNKETGVIRTDVGYEIKGKLDDYIGKISTGDNTGDTTKPNLAKDVLKTDSTATDAAAKSPYVTYNGRDCRVLYNDETHGLQIITDESVETVVLGSGDTMDTSTGFSYGGTGADASESVSINENFRNAAASYNNAVNNLNNKAKLYMDTKGIAKDARCLGSTPTLKDGKFQGDTSKMWYGTYDYLTTYGWNNKFKTTDTNYTEDVKQLNDLGLNVSSGSTWLASRLVYSNSSGTYFYVRRVYSGGDAYNNDLCSVGSGGTAFSLAPSYGFCPVILLASDVVISKGDGSSGNPYVIE